jgi:hypothetical protein
MNDKGSRLTDVLNDEKTWRNNWADGHWKGAAEDRPYKIKMFDERYVTRYGPYL